MKRYSYVTGCDCGFMEDPNGDYVKYSDYEELSDYADSLVKFSKIPCLPKDLENLRDANASFAQENGLLQARICELEAEIRSLKVWSNPAPPILCSSDVVQTHRTWQNTGWTKNQSLNHQSFQ